MTAYYNEIDPYAAQWLRNLIEAGHIAPGIVDERSVEDVRPSEIRGYTQHHFFAGIGVWSYALRLAGWPDDEPVWTGSCPCQPFSAAGKGAGFADERHLWPAWQWLIGECRPPVIVGEQVASKDIDPWIDLVQADVEAMGYAVGCVPFPSAGVGAPHIRDRAYFLAHANSQRRNGKRIRIQPWQSRQARSETGRRGSACELADAYDARSQRRQRVHERAAECIARPRGVAGIVAHADGRHAGAEGIQRRGQHGQQPEDCRIERIEQPGPVNGFWRDADWLRCRDEKWRPVEPGTFPLADGAPSRVGRLRAYGNAINARAAEVFIRSVMDCIP